MTKSYETAMERKLDPSVINPTASQPSLINVHWHLLCPDGAVTEAAPMQIDREADDVVDEAKIGA